MNVSILLGSSLSRGFRKTATRPGRIWLMAAFLLALTDGPRLLHAAAAKEDTGMRAWTSAAGTVIQAQFVEIKAGNIVLRGAKGELFSISPSALSAADREFVQKLAATAATAATPGVTPASTNTLPAFKGGEWDGMAAVYKHRNFIFTMDKTGGWKLQMLDKDKPVGPPIIDNTPGGSYHDTEYKRPGWKPGDPTGRTTPRRLSSFVKRPDQPLMQPSRIELAGLLTDDAAFELTVAFKDNQIQFTGSITDPAGLTYPTRYNIAARFTASHTFGPGTTWENITSALAGCRITLDPPKGKPQIFEYGNTMSGGAMVSILASGPWGSVRTVRVETPKDNDTGRYGGLINYSNSEPYKGYTVAREIVGKGPTGMIRITVE